MEKPKQLGQYQMQNGKPKIKKKQLPQQETFVSKGSYVNGDIVTKDSVIDELPTTTSDLIDSAIWLLPFEERMKCWELIEKLVEEEQETLYTEEQVREAIEDARDILSYVNTDEVIKSLKHKKD